MQGTPVTHARMEVHELKDRMLILIEICETVHERRREDVVAVRGEIKFPVIMTEEISGALLIRYPEPLAEVPRVVLAAREIEVE